MAHWFSYDSHDWANKAQQRNVCWKSQKKVSFNIASEWQKSNETFLVIFKQYNRDEIFHYYYFQAIYEGSEEYASTRKVSSRSSAANLCHPPPRELPGAIPPTKNNLYNHAHLPALVKFPPPSGAELTLKRPRKWATARLVTVMFHMVWNLTRMVQGRLSSLVGATLTLEIVATM